MAKSKKDERQETLTNMLVARGVAREVFKLEQPGHFAIEECYDYLRAIGFENAEEFMADLREAYEDAKTIYSDPPTPEQTFGMFERRFGDEE